jgi:hypothetical protein
LAARRAPFGAQIAAGIARGAPVGEDVIGNFERRGRPAEIFARGGNLVLAQRRAVDVVATLLVGRALADHRAARDQRGAIIGHRGGNRPLDIGEIVAVAIFGVPAAGAIAGQHVFAGRQRGVAIDGDLVVVPQHDHAAQAQRAGQAHGFVVDAFHQAAIARDHPGAVIDQVIAELRIEVAFGHGHAHGHGKALAQRAGGAFHARQQEVFRVAGARAAKLTEIADVVHRRLLVARQVEQRVEQHRTVARREHEAIAIGPLGRGGIELQKARPQHRGNIGHAHRHARVAGSAAWTASIASARIALAMGASAVGSLVIFGLVSLLARPACGRV